MSKLFRVELNIVVYFWAAAAHEAELDAPRYAAEELSFADVVSVREVKGWSEVLEPDWLESLPYGNADGDKRTVGEIVEELEAAKPDPRQLSFNLGEQ